MWVLGIAATFCGLFLLPGFALQIQCYQCEEFQLNNDCSSPEFIVNCTVNVQDMCQKEVMEQSAGETFLDVELRDGRAVRGHFSAALLSRQRESRGCLPSHHHRQPSPPASRPGPALHPQYSS
ncbi:PREDICTED: ly6/PLAUR domain-containing protein 1 isoform X2 [Cercocebus atys]|uniref:ly6/PLAUR domain-containing protein 1 isoform X2 n=1 Tax=Cercocebus atys TaxID=9531 RepID=UPI0005F418B2|nr:PREDICTED: ly6/PLAUR domain-containing protein 1 isoform X2 [Cercocebus atys]